MKYSRIIAIALLTFLCSLASGCIQSEKTPIQVSLQRNTKFTGRGNTDETFVSAGIMHEGECLIKAIDVSLDAADGTVKTLYASIDGERIGSVRTATGRSSYRIRCRTAVNGPATVSVGADISDTAPEGARISVDVNSIHFKQGTVVPQNAGPGYREVLLARKKVFGPGDWGSKNYRIPAIYTLPDGSLLTTTDKRKFNQNDLPDDIDVIASRSTDGGRTWSDPVTVEEGKGFGKGFGDAALVTTASGKVICAYSGGPGLWASNEDNPACNYFRISGDNGTTWGEAVEIHSMLWGRDAVRKECRDSHSAFFGSGRGLRLEKGGHAGRVIFIAAVHSSKNNRFDNYAVYSDDEGRTWNVSEAAFIGGDEAKVVELADGRVLLSVRRGGERGFNISNDGGQTWGKQGLWPEMNVNACDGDIINYHDELLLHSVPNSLKRENVSIFVSRDNGRTWPYVKSICPYESVYSSLTILPDDTIGAYIEESIDGQIEMWFLNFSIDWLLKE